MSGVRLGVVGAGLVGQRHIDVVVANPELELVGIVEPGDAAVRTAQSAGCRLYESLETLLDDGKPDGVIIATPNSLHVEQALLCVQANTPVLVEKPIAVSSSEAAKLVVAAEKADVPILVGHHRRHNPIIKRAKDIVVSGGIGDVRAVQGTCWFYKPDHYFEESPWRKENGAGPIAVNLVHDVDLIRHLVGEVVSVHAHGAPSARGFANEDVAAAVLQFDNGAVGTISVSDSIAAPWSWEHTSKEYPIYPSTPENCYLIGGSAGSLSIPDLRLWRHENGSQDWWTPISATSQICERSDPLVNQMQHFANVIKGKEEPLVSGREGLNTLRVIEAIQNSVATGKTEILAQNSV